MKTVGVVLAGIALLFVSVAQGLVPLLRVAGPMLGIPFTVDCVSLHRSKDGSLRTDVHMLLTRRGFDEVLLAMTYPNQPLRTAVRRLVDLTGVMLSVLAGGTDRHAPNERCKVASYEVEQEGPVAILNYPVVTYQNGTNHRMTLSRAPALGCFALRIMEERQRKDGSWDVELERKAIAVHVN